MENYKKIAGKNFKVITRPSEIKALLERFNNAYCESIYELYDKPSLEKIKSFEKLKKWCIKNHFTYRLNGGQRSGYYTMYARKDNEYIVFSGQTSDRYFVYENQETINNESEDD